MWFTVQPSVIEYGLHRDTSVTVIWYPGVPYHQAVDNVNGEMILPNEMVLPYNLSLTPKFVRPLTTVRIYMHLTPFKGNSY